MKTETYINTLYLDGFLIIEPLLLSDWFLYCKNCLNEENGTFKLTLSSRIISRLEEITDIRSFAELVIENKVDEKEGFREVN